MSGDRGGSHTIYEIKYQLVWVAKYRYHVLKGGGHRARELIRKTCLGLMFGFKWGTSERITCTTHPIVSPSDLMKRIKGWSPK